MIYLNISQCEAMPPARTFLMMIKVRREDELSDLSQQRRGTRIQ